MLTGKVNKYLDPDATGTNGDAKRFHKILKSKAEAKGAKIEDFVVESGIITFTIDKDDIGEQLLAELKEDSEIEVNQVSTFLTTRQIAKRKADAKAAKGNKA